MKKPSKQIVAAPKSSLYLDTRRAKQNGLYPVKLRLHYDGQTKMYPTGQEATQEAFTKAHQPKPRNEHKEFKWMLDEILKKADDILKGLKTFSFPAFEKEMFQAAKNKGNVLEYYRESMERLRQQQRVRTAESYGQSLKSLKAFAQSESRGRKEVSYLGFADVTPNFLKRYESWMTGQGRSMTTVGIYLRALRAVFNEAIEEGEAEKDTYPFGGKKKYQIPQGRNVKKALNKADLKALFTHPTGSGEQEKARDFWFFSYQCNGMNVADIVRLKRKDVHRDFLSFLRKKTAHTTKTDAKPITVPKTSFVQQIIDKYSVPGGPEDYLFPFLQKGMSEDEKVTAVKALTRFINQHIKTLAKAAGVEGEISTYWARHSFATSAIRNGASMEIIQESLGHKDMKTTMNYWSGFTDDVKKDVAEGLMNF